LRLSVLNKETTYLLYLFTSAIPYRIPVTHISYSPKQLKRNSRNLSHWMSTSNVSLWVSYVPSVHCDKSGHIYIMQLTNATAYAVGDYNIVSTYRIDTIRYDSRV